MRDAVTRSSASRPRAVGSDGAPLLIPVVLAFLFLCLTGCGGHVVVGDEEVTAQDQVATLDDQVRIGVSTRDDMHRLLGPPLVSSRTWQLELYRIEEEDAYGVFTWAIIPVPIIPTWFESANQIIYALAAYDRDWTVRDFDTGYFIEGIDTVRDPAAKDAEAADFLMELAAPISEHHPAYEWLYAPREATRDILLGPSQEDACAIYVTHSGVNVRMFMDDELILDERGSKRPGFIAMAATPGTHELKLRPFHATLGSIDYAGEATRLIECQAGQRWFLEIETEMTRRTSPFERNRLSASFVVRDKPLPIFERRRLVLYHNGKWLGPEKPVPLVPE